MVQIHYILINFYSLITPINLNYLWNIGSLLSLALSLQIITGIVLAMHYCADIILSFTSISHIIRDVNYGYFLKNAHNNGASFFFLFIYIKIARNIYYGGYLKYSVWNIGIIIYLLFMLTAFIGYVLPWGQMSFWGATVITNFLTAIPYIGLYCTYWIWGGYSVSNPTLTKFYSLHYFLPFIIIWIIIYHILLLHINGSGNINGTHIYFNNIQFYPYYFIKDIYGFFLYLYFYIFFISFYPNILGDPENYIKANPLLTPIHIMPEWYFLFAYAILRAIPNKIGGVGALVSSILILYIKKIIHTSNQISKTYLPFNKIFFWYFIGNLLLLTWIGSKPIEYPYTTISIYSSLLYFLYYLFFIPMIEKFENYSLYINN